MAVIHGSDTWRCSAEKKAHLDNLIGIPMPAIDNE
jgi:hypothetical protein